MNNAVMGTASGLEDYLFAHSCLRFQGQPFLSFVFFF